MKAIFGEDRPASLAAIDAKLLMSAGAGGALAKRHHELFEWLVTKGAR